MIDFDECDLLDLEYENTVFSLGIPDGNYVATIEDASMVRSKKDRPMLRLRLKIRAGDHKGRICFRNDLLTAEGRNLEFLKRDLTICGLGDVKPSELANHLSRLKGLAVGITRKSGNTYINRLVDVDPDPWEQFDSLT